MAFLLAIPVGIADTNISTVIKSDEDVNSWTGIKNNGSTSVVIDGVNMTDVPYYIQRREGMWATDTDGMERDDLPSILEGAYKYINNKYINNVKSDVFGYQKATAHYLVNIIKSVVYPKLQEHEYRINALEETIKSMNQEAYCDGKIATMKKYNLSSVSCGNKTCQILHGDNVVCGELVSPTKYVIGR